MFRLFAFACLVAGLALLANTSAVDAQAKKNQMVKGTIKSVSVDTDVLVVNQKVKNEFVDRELSILADTEFVVTKDGQTKSAKGNAGLRLLEGAKNASVQVKCDKDVNVLQVKVTIK